MSNLSLTRVNQKLNQARILLNQANTGFESVVHEKSVLEAAVFHLACAYHHYLRELAETYSLKNVLVLKSEADLVKAFDSAKKYPAEANELVALRDDAKSWLSLLHRFYESLWAVPIQPEAIADDLIQLVDVGREELVDATLESVRSWHEQFVSLVSRHRTTSAEF